MGLLSGLEKFGLDLPDKNHLFDDDEEKAQVILEKKKKEKEEAESKKKQEFKETDFLLNKTVRCPVCDETFGTRTVKSGKARRLPPDFDLRPRFSNIDTNKYDVSSCPNCGYTAMHRYFPHLTKGQISLIKEGVCSKFQAPENNTEELAAYTYEEAIDRYKLALYNTIVKKGKTSEKAYACLKISWLYRGWLEEMEEKGITDGEIVEACTKEEAEYYEEAYEGMVKAVASESFPMCGMEESTMNLLLANMAYQLGKLDVASKLVSSILLAPAASHQAKDRAIDLKEDIIKKLHSVKG